MANDRGTPSPTPADRLMRLVWPTPPPDLPERARRRVVLHLIPYLFFLYILAYVDRVNVSVAALGMERPPAEGGLGFDARVIGFGAGVFFWGYWILEMPSTLSVLRWGARYVFVRILVLWGLSCVLIGFIGLPWMDRLLGWLPAVNDWPLGEWLLGRIPHLPDDPTVAHFYFLRFLLGLFEGGFFPSVILYLSLWFRPRDLGRAIATFTAAIPVSSMLGSPLSGALLPLDWLGLPGWRWVFILQCAVPVLAGFVTLFFLPNRPADAACGWLTGQFVRYYFREPRAVLARLLSEDVGLEELRGDMFNVRFLRTHRLNDDLWQFLVEMGYPREEVEFVRGLGKIVPAGRGRRADQRWEKYYTPELRRWVRQRERLIFARFPEFDSDEVPDVETSRAAYEHFGYPDQLGHLGGQLLVSGAEGIHSMRRLQLQAIELPLHRSGETHVILG